MLSSCAALLGSCAAPQLAEAAARSPSASVGVSISAPGIPAPPARLDSAGVSLDGQVPVPVPVPMSPPNCASAREQAFGKHNVGVRMMTIEQEQEWQQGVSRLLNLQAKAVQEVLTLNQHVVRACLSPSAFVESLFPSPGSNSSLASPSQQGQFAWVEPAGAGLGTPLLADYHRDNSSKAEKPHAELADDRTLGDMRAEKEQMPDNFDSTLSASMIMNKDPNSCVYSRLLVTPFFQNVMTSAIVFSILWIGVEANYNHADFLCQAPAVFQLIDNVLCLVFVGELFVRIGASWRCTDLIRCPSFMLDGFLALAMAWEAWVQVLLVVAFEKDFRSGGIMRSMSVLRILRVVRISRFARCARLSLYMPELLTFTEGMLSGMRAVSTTILVLTIVIYAFAVVFTQMLGDTEPCFSTVLTSMHFLFLSALCSIDKNFIVKMLSVGKVYWLMWLCFLVTVNLTIMRMLTGIILSVVSDVNHRHKDLRKRSALEKQLAEQLANMSSDSNGCIAKREFKLLLGNPKITESLGLLGVDIDLLAETVLTELHDDEVDLPVSDLVERVFALRASNPATLRDIMMLRKLEEKVLARQRSAWQRQVSQSSAVQEHRPDGHQSCGGTCLPSRGGEGKGD